MQTSLTCARKLFRAIDTPRALTCEMLVRYGEWDQLATLQMVPSHYLTARDYYLDCVVTEFLRKHSKLPTSFNKSREALSKFFEGEKLCARTNLRFLRIRENSFESASDLATAAFVAEVKKEVSKVLGRLPNEVFPRFGPGATFDDKGRLTTVADKMLSVPTLTRSAECFLGPWSNTAWGRGYLSRYEKGGRLRFENAGRFTTVPKDSKTDRSIDIQPSINIFYQLGVGGAIRQRLAKWGIDLATGQETHRRVAARASLDGSMSTIDLSSASDTISKEVVRAVLPTEWHSLLLSLRTSHTLLPGGRRHYLEKFSAMGNGYTFELETLIFASVVKVVLRSLGSPSQAGVDFFVYGDDMIVPTTANTAVLSALRYFGFVPNPKKTFSTGSFRESCGGDFFDGQPVRATYLKDEPNEPHELIALANGIQRLIQRFHLRCDVVRRRLVRVWLSVLDGLPSDIRRLRGPVSLGDLVIHDDRGWDVRQGASTEIFEIRVWSPVSNPIPWRHWPAWVEFAGALYGVGSPGPLPRGGVSGYRRAWVALLERLS